MSLFTSNFKKIPWAMVLSLLIFFCLQAVLFSSPAFWRMVRYYGNPGFDDPILFEATLRSAARDRVHKKIFILGSSQAKEDYDLAYLNKRLEDQGFKFYNLGMAGTAQPIDLFMMANRLLKYKPDVIIYMPFIASFYESYKGSGHNQIKYVFNPKIVPYLFRYLDRKEFMTLKDDFAQSFLGNMSPMFKYREQLNSIAGNFYKDLTGIEKRNGPLTYTYYEDKPLSHFEKEIEESQGRRFQVTPYTKLNQDLFNEFAKTVVGSGVQLIVVDGPTHPLIVHVYDEDVLDEQYGSFLIAQSRRHGFDYLAADRQPGFDRQDFIDFSHLNSRGRKKFSRFIGDYVSGSVGGEGTGRIVFRQQE